MEVSYDPVAQHEESYLEVVFDRRPESALDDRDTLNAPLRELHLRPAVCTSSDTSLRPAIELMRLAGIGSVVVESEGRLVGIFTERDVLMRVVGEPIDLDRTPVGEMMVPQPETLGLGDAISFAINMMSDGGYRHVPVTDKSGKPLHVVSVRDLAAWLAECHPERVVNLPPTPGRVAARRNGG